MSEPHISPQSKQWILQQIQSGVTIDPGFFLFLFRYFYTPLFLFLFWLCFLTLHTLQCRLSILFRCFPSFFISARLTLNNVDYLYCSVVFPRFLYQLALPRRIGPGSFFISNKLVKVPLPRMLLLTIPNSKFNMPHKAHRLNMPRQGPNTPLNHNISKVKAEEKNDGTNHNVI